MKENQKKISHLLENLKKNNLIVAYCCCGNKHTISSASGC